MNLPLRTLSVAVVTGLLLLAGCGKGQDPAASAAAGQQMPPTTVDVQVVELGFVPITSTFSGRVSAVEVSEVRPQVTGIVDEILFQEGSLVQSGQPLYRINPDNYSSSAAQSEAALNQARANIGTAKAAVAAQQAVYEQARADLARYEELLKIDAVSKQAYEQALTNVKTASASLEQARANLVSSEATARSAEAGLAARRLDLNRTIVRAPISGRAGISSVTKGALVASGQAASLVTISRTDLVFVDISQSSSEILKLREQFASGAAGQGSSEVELVLEDGSVYPIKGQLSFANAEVDPNTGSVTIRAVFQNPNMMLLPGMYVDARINQAVIANAVALPQTAITLTPKGEATVYVVGKDNKIEVRPVKTAGTMNGQWVVTEGLAAGDKVVIMGGAKVKPEQQVQVRSLPAAQAAPSAPQAGEKAGQNSVLSNSAQANAAPKAPNSSQPSATSNNAQGKGATDASTSGAVGAGESGANTKPNAVNTAPTQNQSTTKAPTAPAQDSSQPLSPEEQEMLDSADSSN